MYYYNSVIFLLSVWNLKFLWKQNLIEGCVRSWIVVVYSYYYFDCEFYICFTRQILIEMKKIWKTCPALCHPETSRLNLVISKSIVLSIEGPGVINDLVKKMMDSANKVKKQYEDKLKERGVS